MSKSYRKCFEERNHLKVQISNPKKIRKSKTKNNNNTIDLTNMDLDIPIIIDLDKNEVADVNMFISDCSNISSTDSKNSVEHGNIIHSRKKEQLTLLQKGQISKIKRRKLLKIQAAKHHDDIDNNSIEEVSITIRTTKGRRKYHNRSSFLEYKHATNKKKITKRGQTKLRRRKHKERKGDTEDKFKSTEDCNCCKCIKSCSIIQSYTNVSQYAENYRLCTKKYNHTHRSIRCDNDALNKKLTHDKKEPIGKEIEKTSANKTDAQLKSLVNQDRPLPECRRGCYNSKHSYVPNTQIPHCEQYTELLESISSDDFNSDDASFFNDSDIENLIARTKKRIREPLNLKNNKLTSMQIEDHSEDILKRQYNNKDHVSRQTVSNANSLNNLQTDLSDIDLTESGTTTPVVIVKCDSDILTLKDNEDKVDNIKQNVTQGTSGIIKLVPIEKLMYPEPEVNLDIAVGVIPVKVKPVGTVKPTHKINENNTPTLLQRPKRKKQTIRNNDHKQRRTNSGIAIALQEETNVRPMKLNVAEGTILNDRYDICEIIKKGRYSNVVRAIDKQNGDKVVLKILHQNIYSHTLYNLKLLNGVDAVDKFHCIHLKGQFYVSGHLTLWLESYSSSLRECLNKPGHENGFPLTTVQLLSRQLLLAVQLLREYNILHGDIKPEHILINSTNTIIKLSGFDAARHIQNKLNTVPYLRPINYRAPEIILGMDFDCSVDVWSAACVTYEVATGKRLFTAITENEVLWQIININGRFPKQMRVGKHFDNKGNFVHTFVNCQTKMTERKLVSEVPAAARRDLKAELTRGVAASGGRRGTAAAGEPRLLQLLNTALHTMLLVEPNRRVSVDFALLNQFFQ